MCVWIHVWLTHVSVEWILSECKRDSAASVIVWLGQFGFDMPHCKRCVHVLCVVIHIHMCMHTFCSDAKRIGDFANRDDDDQRYI